MLSEWEAESRYNMDFLVEKRKLEKALEKTEEFLRINGIWEDLRTELRDESIDFTPSRLKKQEISSCLPEN